MEGFEKTIDEEINRVNAILSKKGLHYIDINN